MRITLTLTTWLAVAPTAVIAQERLPVPPPAAQGQAQRALRDTFKGAYAGKLPSEKLALAKTLLERARSRQDDDARQFVAYQEARALATQGNNIELAIQVARECARRFAVAVYPMAVESLAAGAKVPRGLGESRILVHTSMRLAQEAAAAEDVDSAGKAVTVAGNLARPFKDASLDAAVTKCGAQVSELKSWLARVTNARTTLVSSPGDPASHRLLGEYEALRHANWNVGLDHLAKGNDAELKAIALRDLSDASAADDQAALADSWWDVAEHLTGVARRNARQRALTWYEKAGEGSMPVLGQARRAARLPTLRVERLTSDWLPADDPSWFALEENTRFEAGRVSIEPAGTYMTSVSLRLPCDVDGVAVRVRPGPGAKLQAYLVYEPDKECVLYDREQGLVAAAWQSKELIWDHRIWQKPQNADEILIAVVLSETDAIVYVDGVEFGRVPTKLRRLASLSVQACKGTVVFDQFMLRPKDW